MSKRDELKKLRSAQKITRSDDTPAEDYSKNAAEALAAAEKPVEEKKAPVAEDENPPVSTAINTAAVHTEPEYVPQKENTPLPAEDETPSADSQSAISDAAPAQAADFRPENTAMSYSIANEPGKRISVSLKTENKNWMHRTAIRCGLSIQDYINILISEAWEREKQHPYIWNESDPLPERIPSSKTVLVAIKLTSENIDRTKRMRASHCMTMTFYMNYLIEEEIKREQTEGMRRPVFDEV